MIESKKAVWLVEYELHAVRTTYPKKVCIITPLNAEKSVMLRAFWDYVKKDFADNDYDIDSISIKESSLITKVVETEEVE